MTTLTNEEKIAIVTQHIKSVEYSLYNSQLDLIEAQAGATPDAETIANINSKITTATAKLTALNEELNSLS